MKISAKMEYACVAMLELALQYGSGKPVRIRWIADRHDVPSRFLVQILLELKEAGLVTSVRGAAGGYQLRHPPGNISLGQVVDVIKGASRKDGQTTNASPDSNIVQVLQQIWNQVEAAERQMLNDITLADLSQRARGQDEQMDDI